MRVTATSPVRRERGGAAGSESTRQAPGRAEQAEQQVEQDEQQDRAKRHDGRSGLEADVADLGGDRAGQAGQRPGKGEHQRGNHQHAQDAAHQPCVAQEASAALASSSARAWASQSAIGWAAGPVRVATVVTAPARSPASRDPRARASTPAAASPTMTRSPWRIVTRSWARSQIRSSSGNPSVAGRDAARAAVAAGGEGEDELCLGGRLRGGEAGERGWCTLEDTELLARVERDPGGLDLGGAPGGLLQSGEASLVGIEPAG